MTITGSCHCGKTSFLIDADIPETLTRCTCSFCAKRGALLAYYQPAQFQVTAAAQDDAVYRWNTQLVAHHFCAGCGCATYSDSPALSQMALGTNEPVVLASMRACSMVSTRPKQVSRSLMARTFGRAVLATTSSRRWRQSLPMHELPRLTGACPGRPVSAERRWHTGHLKMTKTP